MQQDWRKPLLGAREPVWTGYRLSACEHQEGRTFEVRYRKPPPLAVVVDFKNVDPAYNVVTKYRPPVPVGGIVVPVNRLGLVALRLGSGQAPWLGLATLAGLAALGVVLVRKRKL